MSTAEGGARGWDPRVLLATWFGTGLIRPAPGTWGSVVAGLLALGFLLLAPPAAQQPALFAACAVVSLVGVYAAPAAIRQWGVADPSQVVIDEVAGTWLAVACLPPHVLANPVPAVAAAVTLFRVFDIAKPWPVGWCERLPGGWGIMADDLAAGALAGCLAATVLG